ncbi:MAG: sodium-dependent bicarbonate transport family permease [Pseudomonadota bacterium]
MDVAIQTLLSPIILFFLLGMIAALLRSQMSVPEAFAKGLAIYLMMAIGLKGGVEMAKNPITLEVGLVFLVGILLSFAIPVLAFAILRLTTKLPRVDAAAVSAHYGSISIVTFVAATEAVRMSGLDSSGHLVAVAALMETPEIVSALILFLRGREQSEKTVAGSERGELVREVALNASIVVLVGSLLIGWIAGEEGTASVRPLFVVSFQGGFCGVRRGIGH